MKNIKHFQFVAYIISIFIFSCLFSMNTLQEPLLAPTRKQQYHMQDMAEVNITRSVAHTEINRKINSLFNTQSIQKQIFSRNWLTTHGPGLIVSCIACGFLNQFYGGRQNWPAALFARHAFAERISHSLRNLNWQLEADNLPRSIFLNIISLLAKWAITYSFYWFIVYPIESTVPNGYFGIADATVLADLYTLAQHFTDEKHEFRTEFTHELRHTLHSPVLTELTSKIVETQITKPELFVKQLYDEEIVNRLQEIHRDPVLKSHFQRAWEAQWALLLRQAMNIVPSKIESTSVLDDSIRAELEESPRIVEEGAGAMVHTQASSDLQALHQAIPAELEAHIKAYITQNANYLFKIIQQESQKQLVALTANIKTNQERNILAQELKHHQAKTKYCYQCKQGCTHLCNPSSCLQNQKELITLPQRPAQFMIQAYKNETEREDTPDTEREPYATTATLDQETQEIEGRTISKDPSPPIKSEIVVDDTTT